MPSPVGERLVEQPGGHAAGLVGVVDALAVERVDRAGGVADDDPGGPDLRARPSRPSAGGRRSAAEVAVSGEMPQCVGSGGRELVA